MGPYGLSTPTICGAGSHGTSLPPTPFNFCLTYPKDSSCQELVNAAEVEVNSNGVTTRPPVGSSGTAGKSCTSNASCVTGGLCFGITPNNRVGVYGG